MRKVFLLVLVMIGIASLLSVTARSQDAGNRQSVNYADLGKAVKVIGPLEEPLGKVLQIEGKLVPMSERHTYWAVNIAQNLFAVEKIDGKSLPRPLQIELSLPTGHAPLTNKSGAFTGYQDGGFINVPPEVEAMRPPGTLPMQSNGWHFEVKFICIAPQVTK